ncbi:cd7643f0-92e1-42b1-83a7-0c494d1e932f [Thermothielavioides terrestris]|uniref:Cd7643f0-92e1-42b1-83a7-0c494d1e932f n=1 Tax=Thermothielavioides terrestris TaxID=2587410 RepID=A0A3S4C9I4_9PEZI|nr:cd7643f0-92e1-42b1-83a7-0c494d1e932f [Thermothielavioides terrestris]
MPVINVGTSADPVVTRLVAEDKVVWYKKPNLRRMYIFLFLCCMGVEMTSGFDSQLINTLQYAQTFHQYLGNGRKDAKGNYAIEPGLLGFVNSCYQLGSIFAVPLAPWFAQRFGRRWSVMLGSWIMVVGALIQGFAQHVAMYIIARMILGMGILFCIVSGAALLGELGHPKERAVLTSLFNSSYFIGQITASAIAIRTPDLPGNWAWRVPSLLQICPSLLQICTIFFVPESPRYLISKDRDDDAREVLIKYHAEGDASSLLVQAEMVQIRETIHTEKEVSRQSWWELLRSAGMRRRVLISIFLGIFTQMSGNTLLSYYSGKLFDMMGFTAEDTKTRINLANACWGFINATTLALIITRFRRRVMFMVSATSMCLVFIAMTVSLQRIQVAQDAGTTNQAAGISGLFWYFAYSPCYNLGNNALTYTYLVELWPYSHRSRGIGVQQIFGKLAGFFSTNVNSIALDAIKWIYLAIYCGWIFFELCIVYWLYPETSGRTLEELAFLFEDSSLNERTVSAVEKQIHYGDAHDVKHDEGQPVVEVKSVV